MFYPSVEVICGFAGLVRDLDIDPLHERLRLCDVLSRHCANVELGDDVVPAVLAEHTTTLAPGPVLTTHRSGIITAALRANSWSISREAGIFKHGITPTNGHLPCVASAACDVTLTSVSV